MNSYWIKSGIYTTLERLFGVLLGVGGVFILLRALSKEDFGIWAIFLTINAFIEVSRNGLIQNALIKFLSSVPKKQHSAIHGASFALNMLITSANITVLFLSAKLFAQLFHCPDLEYMLYIYGWTTAALLPLSHYNFIQQAYLDFRGVFWSSMMRQGLFFAYIAYLYFGAQNVTLIKLAFGQVISTAIAAAIAFLFARRFVLASPNIEWSLVRQLFNYGKYILGTNLSSMIYKNVDKFMLGSLSGSAAVAIYDLAIRINNFIEIPSLSMAAMAFPQFAKQCPKVHGQAIRELYEFSVGSILGLILPAILLVSLFPEQIITLLAGEKYIDAAPILRLTLLFGLFLPFAVQFGSVFDSINKAKINFMLVMAGALLNVILNFLFIGTWGIYGSVYATLITLSLFFVISQYLLYKELKVNFLRCFANVPLFYAKIFRYSLQFLKKQRNQTPQPVTQYAPPPAADLFSSTTNCERQTPPLNRSAEIRKRGNLSSSGIPSGNVTV